MSTEKPENMNVTSAQEIKNRAAERQAGRVLKLPSGLVVRCKRPSVNYLIAAGHVPSDVAAALLKGQPGGQSVEDFKKLVELQRVIVTYALVEPKIVDEPDYSKNEIAIDDLDDIDVSFVMTYVQSGVDDLALFRALGSVPVTRPDLSQISEP